MLRLSRPVGLILVIAACVAITKLIVENVLGLNTEALVAGWIANPGIGAAALVFVLLAADIFLPVPSSLVMVLSGSLLGLVWGSVAAMSGSIVGQWLGYELARRYGSRVAARFVSTDERERLGAIMARHGSAAVIVTRALPILLETMSVVAGLSGMRRSTFLLSAIAGTAPIVVVYAYAGAVARDTGNLIPAVIMLVALAAGAWLVTTRRSAR